MLVAVETITLNSVAKNQRCYLYHAPHYSTRSSPGKQSSGTHKHGSPPVTHTDPLTPGAQGSPSAPRHRRTTQHCHLQRAKKLSLLTFLFQAKPGESLDRHKVGVIRFCFGQEHPETPKMLFQTAVCLVSLKANSSQHHLR